MRLNPKLQFELSFEDRYVDLVAHGIDVAIRVGPLADSTLGASYLGLNPWVVVAASSYLAEWGTPLAPADLAAHDALIYSTVQGDARWHFTGSDGQALSVPLKGPLRSNSLSALLAAARGAMGVAALPWYVAQKSLRGGAVVRVLADWSLPVQEIHAVYPSPQLVPPKVSGFVAWLHGQFGDEWWIDSKGPETTAQEAA
jgi:DNA-binding transcriptional LysR family regulator